MYVGNVLFVLPPGRTNAPTVAAPAAAAPTAAHDSTESYQISVNTLASRNGTKIMTRACSHHRIIASAVDSLAKAIWMTDPSHQSGLVALLPRLFPEGYFDFLAPTPPRTEERGERDHGRLPDELGQRTCTPTFGP